MSVEHIGTRRKDEPTFSLLESEVIRFGRAERSIRESGMHHYAPGPNNRERNGAALTDLWLLYEEIANLHDFLQKVYIAQVKGKLAVTTEAFHRNSDGTRSRITMQLDQIRTFAPSLNKDFLAYKNITKHKEGRLTPDELRETMWMIQEYCEIIAQDQYKTALLKIHDPALLTKYHESTSGDRKKTTVSVNVRKKFTFAVGQRLFHKRVGFRMPDTTSVEAMQDAANRYSDSLRMLGENLTDDGQAYDRPAVNIILCALTDLSWLSGTVSTYINAFSNEIVKEMSAYQGIRTANGYSLDKPVSLRYAEGVTVTAAARPVTLRQIVSLNARVVSALSAAGALSVELPLMVLKFRGERVKATDPNFPPMPDYTPMWHRGRAGIISVLDKKIAQLKREEYGN